MELVQEERFVPKTDTLRDWRELGFSPEKFKLQTALTVFVNGGIERSVDVAGYKRGKPEAANQETLECRAQSISLYVLLSELGPSPQAGFHRHGNRAKGPASSRALTASRGKTAGRCASAHTGPGAQRQPLPPSRPLLIHALRKGQNPPQSWERALPRSPAGLQTEHIWDGVARRGTPATLCQFGTTGPRVTLTARCAEKHARMHTRVDDV
ncbi:hypothetical protein SKAU_G00043630 [Synaphobranchus kaupii]|uniref:Uncharacterized protein n=1 Tax=Synaphobranchus kaupii TaxID=118154 RepID=A0A9Q1G2G6_SYNKA|nr:hypothetical protein SKAU_G00043630 [Synaphobranchus kaupii]